jgi:hypothetical protein
MPFLLRRFTRRMGKRDAGECVKPLREFCAQPGGQLLYVIGAAPRATAEGPRGAKTLDACRLGIEMEGSVVW